MKELIVVLICFAAALGCTALGIGLFIVGPQPHPPSQAKRHVDVESQKTSELTPV